MIEIDLPDESATASLAAQLAALAQPGDVIALQGELGVGKTSFARAFIRARGDAPEVPSPTFTLVQIYDFPDAAIWHFDGYLLRDPEEAWELGIEDAFRDGALVPPRRLEIALGHMARPTMRHARLQPGSGTAGGWSARLAGLKVRA